MKIEIQPIEIGLPKRTAAFIELRAEFTIGGETSRVFFQLFDSENNQLSYGTIDVDSETHLAWGVSDDIIIDYAINQLGLELL